MTRSVRDQDDHRSHDDAQSLVEVASVGIFRKAGGRLAEHWGVFDQSGMLAQLGALG